MKTASQLLREAEGLKSRVNNCTQLVGNNEAWAVQHQLQVVCGQLLVHWNESALDHGVERDLWNLGFRNTITQLQAQAKDKQGGTSEARDMLGWFLNSAQGFYLQLFNQICTEYALDLPFRRKDSVYGCVEVGGVAGRGLKNALYLCQYCLVHLGDLARYRHHAKQAETYYKHAVVVAPTSGHPYNQLALLEAGRGNRLAAVALYVRAMCVPCPFPGAPANLTQTLSKLLSTSREVSHSSRMTSEEYTSLFLQCHARLYLHGDVASARKALSTLCSALSTLVATSAFTRTSLIQMVLVNLFALNYYSGSMKVKVGDDSVAKKDEEKPEKTHDPKEGASCLRVVEQLTVGVLAALLLPVHTIRDPDQLLTYPALPAIRLVFEWVRCEGLALVWEAMKGKQQIWPGLCTLVNNVQPPLQTFAPEKYNDVPLVEDWDLQGFEPLQKMLSKYKYREGLTKPSPEEYNMIRASRLTDVAKWFAEQNIEGTTVIKVRGCEGGLVFEALQHSSPPAEEVRALEQLSLHPRLEDKSSRRGKVGILKPQGSLERARETRDHHDDTHDDTHDPKDTGHAKGPAVQNPGQLRPSRTRTNVALQAIMKRNSALQEAKQVTFKTPSPAISPNPSEASSDSHRSQLSTPPLLPVSQRESLGSSPMPQHLPAGYQGGSMQAQVSSGIVQGHPVDNGFPKQQQQYSNQVSWMGVPGMAGNSASSPGNVRPQMHQQNLAINQGGNKQMQEIRQFQSNLTTQSDIMNMGMFNRAPLDSFHQKLGPPPRRPGDTGGPMREPVPRMLEMMGMARAPPSFGPVDGVSSAPRFPPPGTDNAGFDVGPRMTQAPYITNQGDIDPPTSQAKMAHPILSPGAMTPHMFGVESRQNVGAPAGFGIPGGARNVFGESDMSPRTAGLSPPLGIGWGPNQIDKNFHMNHPPPTLANLLQQHGSMDMRHNLGLEPAGDHFSSNIARLGTGPLMNPPALGSGGGVGPLSTIHLEMLASTQPPSAIAQQPNQQSFLSEQGGDGDGRGNNTYSLFSPMSGGNMGMGSGPSRTVPHPLYPSTSQPTGQQSLWSGPGPSPLERLLEQKKYSSVPK